MKYLRCLLVVLTILLSLSNIVVAIEKTSEESEELVAIESMDFFKIHQGTDFVYFGRPTCIDCVKFETLFLEYLNKAEKRVYYFNTLYWKESPGFDDVLEKYKVTAVPAIVKITNGEFSDICFVNPEQKNVSGTLDAFFKNGTLRQFTDGFLAVTFFILLFDAVYVSLRKKAIVEKGEPSSMIVLAVNATLVICLHYMIVREGWLLVLQFDAVMDKGALAWIGEHTWLAATPLLYLVTVGQCIDIGFRQSERVKREA